MYELHISVEEHPSIEQTVKFTEVCEEMLGKCLLFQLANGDFPLQLMISRRSELNDDATAVKWARTQAEMIKQLGWNVVRVKVEAPFSSKTYGPKLNSMYTEAHWKFHLYNNTNLRSWLDSRPELGFRHSWNVMNEGVNYLTARSQDLNVTRVQTKLDQLGAELVVAGFCPVKVHYERVLYDSNLRLDHGWDR